MYLLLYLYLGLLNTTVTVLLIQVAAATMRGIRNVYTFKSRVPFAIKSFFNYQASVTFYILFCFVVANVVCNVSITGCVCVYIYIYMCVCLVSETNTATFLLW